MNLNLMRLVCAILCLCVDHSAGQSSPCPNVFQYVHDGNEWYGLIKPQSFRVVETIKMKVLLSLEAELPSSYVGSVQLSQSLDATIKNIEANGPFSYTIRFPIQSTLPEVTEIAINDETICSGRQYGPYVSKITLHHKLSYAGFSTRQYTISQRYVEITTIQAPIYSQVQDDNTLGSNRYEATSTPAPIYSVRQDDNTLGDNSLQYADTHNGAETPCSEIFKYQFEDNEWIGLIAPQQFSTGPTIKLEVELSLRAILSSQYVGTVRPYNPSLAETVEKIRWNQPFWYKVTFPLQNRLPKVTKIAINDQTLCSSLSESEPTESVSIITLKHSIHSDLPIAQYLSYNSLEPRIESVTETSTSAQVQWQPTTTKSTTPTPTTRLTTPTTRLTKPPTRLTKPPTRLTTPPTKLTTPTTRTTQATTLTTTEAPTIIQPAVSTLQCGIVEVDTTSLAALRIIGGNQTVKGQYPFLAALFELSDSSREKKNKFFCGGTLISNGHVLTAAHCVRPKNSKYEKSADEISLVLGKYNLKSEDESEVNRVIQSDIDKIYVNPDWDPKSIRYDADLAILVLNVKVAFTKFIRPVCLPINKDENIDRMTGMIAGWGLIDNNDTPATILKHANICIDKDCLTKDDQLSRIASARTFCGIGNGAPNEGDSVGGFFVQSNDKWTQYGIISSIRTNKKGTVEDGAFSVFTSVKEFKDWIYQTVNHGDDRKPLSGTLAALQRHDAPPHIIPTENTRFHDSSTPRISARKCNAYQEFAFKKAFFGTFIDVALEVRTSNCAVKSSPLIIGGSEAAIGEYPHMALIGFKNKSSGLTDWDCGGSLISELFVLTAAHCNKNRNNEPARYVRLGEHDLDRTDEAASIDFDITKRIPHPNYQFPYNDIMLLQLNRMVKFNSAIRPICLPDQFHISVGDAIASGWGLTMWNGNQSNVLLKVNLNIFSQEECSRKYATNVILNDKIVEDIHLCAGSRSDEKDTCQGDSGGPIQTYKGDSKCIYTLLGVTSFGSLVCGTQGTPGVYTRVFTYLDWIEKHVWPNQ